MDVFDMAPKIIVISNQMFPEPSLPEADFFSSLPRLA